MPCTEVENRCSWLGKQAGWVTSGSEHTGCKFGPGWVPSSVLVTREITKRLTVNMFSGDGVERPQGSAVEPNRRGEVLRAALSPFCSTAHVATSLA